MANGSEQSDTIMIALGLLVVIAVLITLIIYASTRPQGRAGEVTITTTPSDDAGVFRDIGMRRWVDAGLLTEEQARAIEQFEATRRTPAESPRVSPAIEALAYVGGALLAVGAGMLISRFWEDMGNAAHLGIVGVAAAGTGVIGTVVGEAEPVARRLRGFLWALSAVGLGAFAGLFMFGVFDRTGEPVAFATAAATAVLSGLYWRLRDRPLQHALTFVALVVTTGVGIGLITSANPSAWIGLTFWMLGALWAFAAWQRKLPPEIIGFALGAILTLVGAGITGNRYDWLAPLLGLATAAAWTATGVGMNEVLALVPGVIGIFIYLPWTLGRFFGESLGAPVIVMLSGALLLGIVVILWRRRSQGAQIGDLWGGHFSGVAHQ